MLKTSCVKFSADYSKSRDKRAIRVQIKQCTVMKGRISDDVICLVVLKIVNKILLRSFILKIKTKKEEDGLHRPRI